MVELEVLQRGERTVALLDERGRAQVGIRRRADPVVARVRLAQKRQRDEEDGENRHNRSERDRHACAGAKRVASLRCSRASGHSAISEPITKMIAATQIRLTSGFTSTLKNTTFEPFWKSAIT